MTKDLFKITVEKDITADGKDVYFIRREGILVDVVYERVEVLKAVGRAMR